MMQIIKSNIDQNWPLIEIDFEKHIELFIDSFYGFEQNKNSFKILLIKEAEAISSFRKQAIENHKNFDVVLSYDEEILKRCTNSHFFPFGTSWIHSYNFPKKKFQVSCLVGSKMFPNAEGHVLRQKVHFKQTKIKGIPIDFYISQHGGPENFNNNKILGESKSPLFDSQFHICIENSRQSNYFSEKIMDCFVTKTIPIYYGCPNIDDFFDVNGIFIINSVDDILDICNNKIQKDTYRKMMPHIENNFVLTDKYKDIRLNLENKIKEMISTLQ